MTDISTDLDGNIGKQEARATGQMYCQECAATARRNCCPAQLYTEQDAKRWAFISQEALMDASDMPSAVQLAHVLQNKYDEFYRHLRAQRAPARRSRKHAGHTLGARIFTLTYSPKWCDDTTARNRMVIAIKRLLGYYKNEIVDFKAVGEVGKNGLSHIHGYYLLEGGRKITDKNFKRAWDHWNPHKKMNGTGTSFEGGHHDLCTVESDYTGYIGKEKNPWYEYTYASQNHETPSASGTSSLSDEVEVAGTSDSGNDSQSDCSSSDLH